MKLQFKIAIKYILYAWLLLFFFHKISLVHNVDMGRHLQNGEILLEGHQFIHTNFYSFTEPRYPVINHHWGSGVAFYWVKKMTGFHGLVVFNLLLWFCLILCLDRLVRLINPKCNYTLLLFLLLIPLFSGRPQIRPEIFTYLFVILFLYLTELQQRTLIRPVWLYLSVFVIQALWNNLHILFILGPFILGLKLISVWIFKKHKVHFEKFLKLLIVDIVALLVNANGLKGIIEPFIIRQNVTLIPAEFLGGFHWPIFQHFDLLTGFSPYILFLVLLIFVFVSGIVILFQPQYRQSFFYWLLSLAFGIFALLMQRNISLFAYVAFVLFNSLVIGIPLETNVWLQKRAVPLVVFLVVLCGITYYWPFGNSTGTGIVEQEIVSSRLFEEQIIKPPVFNDFDIGGYIIYFGYPEVKPFIDSRPEAYSRDFSLNSYWPVRLNTSPEAWQQLDSTYHFNTIFLSNKSTFHKNGFINMISHDATWSETFKDKYVIVFTRKSIVKKD